MDVNKDIKVTLDGIQKSYNSAPFKYEPYIKYIRFPKYKALSHNARINFKFPITVLVGKNGCNKTSILQALYGAPRGTSVGEYWFSTNVDKIEDGSRQIDRNCFVYGYHHKSAKKVIEILKTRIKKKENPDYWEPARPNKQYGMEIPTKEELKLAKNTSETRWDLIEKNIVYCDCKEYVSAYDLFFYHYDFRKTNNYPRKQDFIRYRSTKLAEVIQENHSSYEFYSKNRVIQNEKLPDEVCGFVSEIMGENYSEIRIITHSLYTNAGGNKPSKTIWMKKNDKEYSEAFAGTGESRVILLVNDVYNAEPNSLILIDEPEISLHPSAIYGLKKFLLNQALAKKHQMVITTHSTHIIKDLPNEAIKLLCLSEQGVNIIEDVEYQEAFYEIGERVTTEKTIFVEDKLSKWIVEHVIDMMDKSYIKENLSVKILFGGASNIVKNIYTSSTQNQQNCYYLLDGDQKVNYSQIEEIKEEWINEKTNKIDSTLIPTKYYNELGVIIEKLSGKIDFAYSASKVGKNNEELQKIQLKYLDYWVSHVYFMEDDTPEISLIKIGDQEYDFSSDKKGKDHFVNKAKKELAKDDVTSEDIFYEQKRYVGKIQKTDNLFISI
ncbi:AAA family ATPase, partial [Enterococcus faecalis]|nr:AAA family ATPase [Enterococcus faecalis]